MSGKRKKIIIISIISLLVIGTLSAIIGYTYYNKIYKTNIETKSGKSEFLYVYPNTPYNNIIDSISEKCHIKSPESLDWVAQIKKYPSLIKPGRYKLKPQMSNNDLINMLRSGNQAPVKLTFNNIRTKTQLAGKISKYIIADSLQILNALNNNNLLEKYGFNSTVVLALFIPNTYEFYWNTSAEKFIDKMHDEYQKFWTDERLQKAKEINLTPIQVSILASIVQAEQSQHKSEQPKIAGVYINRLKQGINLESCPTLIYAMGDFTITRVLLKHMEVVSPYNTYKNPGLPPSPIMLPEISALDAVLNYEPTDYIFFCAKEDFSGYHYFSKTNAQHEAYARKYQAQLDKRGIK